MTAAEPAIPDPDRPATIAWLLGIGLFAGIAASAAKRLVDTMAEVAAEIATRQAVAGLVAVTLYSLVATGLLIGMAFVARRLGPRWTLGIGLAVTTVIRGAIAFGVDAPLIGEWLANHTDGLRIAADGLGVALDGDRSPGYPVLLGGAYALLGTEPRVLEALNIVLALAVAALLFDLLRRAHGLAVAGIGIGLFAVLPSQAFFVPVPSWEGAVSAAVLGALWCLVALPDRRPGFRRWRLSPGATVTVAGALAGILLALAQYAWTWSLLLLPAFVVVSIRVAGSERAPRRAAVALLLAFLAALLPVVVDNAVSDGRVSLATSSTMGREVYIGTDARIGGQSTPAVELSGWEVVPAGLSDEEASRLGLGRIIDDPAGHARLVLRKEVTLWGDARWAPTYTLVWQTDPLPSRGLVIGLSVASQLTWTFVALAAVWGIARLRRRVPVWLLAGLLLVGTATLLHVVVAVDARFQAYLAPFIVGAAAVGLVGVERTPLQPGRSVSGSA